MNLKKHYTKQKKPDTKDYILYEIFRKDKSMEPEGRTVVAWGWAWEQGFVASGHERTFWSDGKI